jgi:hypothetical protein
LTCWYYITSDDSCGRDYAGVQVSGANIVNYNLCASTSMTAYAQHSVDMSGYAGTSPELRFWATNNNNSHSSFRIDDASLVMCVPATPPATVCGNLPSSYGIACHRALAGSSLRLGDAWGNQDGIIGFTNFIAGETTQIQVSVQGTPSDIRFLRLWFDWDSDGVFDEDERVFSDTVVDGVNTIEVAVPAGLSTVVNYRFRLYDGQPIEILAQDHASFGDVNGGDITDGESPDPTPTAVTLARFEVMPHGNTILVAWETATELDNVGFNLYRGETSDGPWVRLNTELIPAQQPGTVIGAVYEWLDADVTPGVTYYYSLEDVDTKGVSTFHGPVSASISAPNAATLLALYSQKHILWLPLLILVLFIGIRWVRFKRSTPWANQD